MASSKKMVMMRFPHMVNGEATYELQPVAVDRVQYAREKYGAIIDEKSLPWISRQIKHVADVAPTVVGLGGEVVGGLAGVGLAGPETAATGGIGVVAVPATIAGARAVGSAAGAAAGQQLKEGAYSMLGLGDAPGDWQHEAQTGAVGSIIGTGAGLGLKGLGHIGMSTALGQNVAKNAEVIGKMLEERIPVGKIMRKGGDVADKLWRKAVILRDAALRRANKSGVTFDTSELETLVRDMAKRARAVRNNNLADVLEKRLDDWLYETKVIQGVPMRVRRNPLVGVTDLHEMKQDFDGMLDSYFNSVGVAGKRPNPRTLPPDQRFETVMADWMRDKLASHVPDLKGVSYRMLEKSVGLATKVRDAVLRAEANDWTKRVGSNVLGAAGTGMALGALTHGATGGNLSATSAGAATGALLGAMPNVLSRLSILAGNPVTERVMQYGVPATIQAATNLGQNTLGTTNPYPSLDSNWTPAPMFPDSTESNR